MTSGSFNNAAILRAAANGSGENLPASLGQLHRRSLPAKQSGSTRAVEAMSVDVDREGNDVLLMDTSTDENRAFEHGTMADSLLQPAQEGLSSKARSRRASEGAHLSKGDGKRASGELKCEKCGKGYKHSSCLTKHLLVSSLFLCSGWSIALKAFYEACFVLSFRQWVIP